MWLCACVHLGTCGSQTSTLDVFLRHISSCFWDKASHTLSPHFSRHSLSVNLELISSARLSGSWTPAPMNNGFTNVCWCAHHFYVGIGDPSLVSHTCMAGTLSIEPSPKILFKCFFKGIVNDFLWLCELFQEAEGTLSFFFCKRETGLFSYEGREQKEKCGYLL